MTNHLEKDYTPSVAERVAKLREQHKERHEVAQQAIKAGRLEVTNALARTDGLSRATRFKAVKSALVPQIKALCASATADSKLQTRLLKADVDVRSRAEKAEIELNAREQLKLEHAAIRNYDRIFAELTSENKPRVARKLRADSSGFIQPEL